MGRSTLRVTQDPKNRIPKRTQFIAGDFTEKLTSGSDWTSTLQNKVEQIFRSDAMKKNLVPGVKVKDLVACCGLSEEEALQVTKFMAQKTEEEEKSFFTPNLLQEKRLGTMKGNNRDSATNTQTTNTHTTTTEKSSNNESSGALMVVVAVAGILVLIAVVALIVVTNRSKAGAERVVNLRQHTTRQASWQKGGAVDMDF